DAADDAAVKVRFLFLCKLLGLGGHAAPAGLEPGDDVGGEEQEKVAHRSQDQEPIDPFAENQREAVAEPHDEGEPFDPHRQNEEKVQLEIGIQKRKRQKDRALEEPVGGRYVGLKKRHADGGDQADQQVDVVAERAPEQFERFAHQVEQVP